MSGNSIFRLLAWTVADARGATAALEKPLALTIGRRLDSRAETVRDELAAAAAAVEECRVDLSNEERSTRREGELREYAAMFAEAKAEQQRRVKKHARDEVCIGFHELESLLPKEPASPTGLASPSLTSPPSAIQPSTSPYVDPMDRLDTELRKMGVYYPWKLIEDFEQEDYSAVWAKSGKNKRNELGTIREEKP